MGDYVRAGDLDTWTEQVGEGPDVLLIGGLGDTVESWQFQLDGLADRYRLIAFDNRGAGRTAMPKGPVSAAVMADDAAAVLRALDVPSAHVAGFSMGARSRRSWRSDTPSSSVASSSTAPMPAPTRCFARSSTSGAGCRRPRRASTPSSRPSSRGSTRRAHTDGSVAEIIEGALNFPHGQSAEAFQAQVDVCREHDTADRLSQIAAPTLVLAGEFDVILPPRFGHAVADAIPGARFEMLPGEAHQPFQEAPDEWNARVDAFWREVEARD